MLEKVIKILAEQLDLEVDEIKADSNIQEDLEADSLDVMDIMSELEEEFGLEIDDYAIEGLNTPQKIATYIEENKQI